MKRNLRLLTSPCFLLGLSLLLANDFLFKPFFHNWLTGKLSDFAGLFILPLFLATFAPRQRRSIYWLTAIAFAFWKSLYSQPLIDWWNALTLFRIERTVDLTDLMALVVLLPSYFYFQSHQLPSQVSRFAVRRLATYAVIVTSLFAFTATQRAGEQRLKYDKQYSSHLTRLQVGERLRYIGLERITRISTEEISNTPFRQMDYYRLTTKSNYCQDRVDFLVEVIELERGSLLQLNHTEYLCGEQKPEQKDELLAIFEREVVGPINAEQNTNQ